MATHHCRDSSNLLDGRLSPVDIHRVKDGCLRRLVQADIDVQADAAEHHTVPLLVLLDWRRGARVSQWRVSVCRGCSMLTFWYRASCHVSTESKSNRDLLPRTWSN